MFLISAKPTLSSPAKRGKYGEAGMGASHTRDSHTERRLRWAASVAYQKSHPELAPSVSPLRGDPPPPLRGGGKSGLSLTTLSALAILVAGLIIAAQALFIPMKAQAAQLMMSRAWATTLATDTPTKPWSWADFTPVAKLSFPGQRRSVLALSDAAGESLAFGPTLMAASAEPGQRGVTVFAAHRDTHFAFLDKLKTGDAVTVATREGDFTYTVTGHEVVRWDSSGIHPADNGPARLALVTCWPLNAKFRGPLRYVVWAELTD